MKGRVVCVASNPPLHYTNVALRLKKLVIALFILKPDPMLMVNEKMPFSSPLENALLIQILHKPPLMKH